LVRYKAQQTNFYWGVYFLISGIRTAQETPGQMAAPWMALFPLLSAEGG
jgi:hypothetical protein